MFLSFVFLYVPVLILSTASHLTSFSLAPVKHKDENLYFCTPLRNDTKILGSLVRGLVTFDEMSQQADAGSKSTIETLEKGM